MAPYFDTIKSFETVTVTDAGVNTLEFLEAAKGVVGLFDLLGSVAFAAVKADLSGNIEKVRTRYNAAPEISGTLEQLVKAELAEEKKTATGGLMWLLRGMLFTYESLQKSQADKSKALSAAFNEGYAATLKSYHNMLIKGVFAVAMKACPTRDGLFNSLSQDPDNKVETAELEKKHPEVEAKLNPWLDALGKILQRLKTFYASLNNKDFVV